MNDEQRPYAPPGSPVKDVGEVRSRPVLGIVLGVIVDIGGTLLSSLILSTIFAIKLLSQGATPEQIEETLIAPSLDSGYFFIGSAIGLVFSVLGGYVCSSLAKTSLYKWGIVLASVVCLFGFLLAGIPYSLGIGVILVVTTFGAVLFGVWLYVRKHRDAGI
jgi:hypothetical protein